MYVKATTRRRGDVEYRYLSLVEAVRNGKNVTQRTLLRLGEVSELDPGKSGTLTLKLDPGTYMLFCNIPGHYMAGMWTTVTVK